MADQTPNSHPITKSATEVRQGEKTGAVRWMLLISTIAAVVAMLIAYWVVRGF